MKNKIILGTISIASVASPLAVAVSCGDESKKTFGFEVTSSDSYNSGVTSGLKLLPNQPLQEENINSGKMERILEIKNGKTVLKDADNVSDKELDGIGEVILNVTLSDAFKNRIMSEYAIQKKKRGDGNFVPSIIGKANDYAEKEFFENLTDEANAEKWSNKIKTIIENDQNSFKLKFNLILPKWLNQFQKILLRWKRDSNRTHAQFEQINSIQKEKGSNFNVETIALNGLDLTSFDATNGLPSELETLDLSANDLTSFDATNLPKNLEILDIASNNVKSFDATNLPNSIRALGLQYNNLTSFDATNLPNSIRTLDLQYNDLTSFDATHLPRNLHQLYLNDNPKLTSFTLANIPKHLRDFEITPSGLTREKRSEIFNKIRENYKKYNDD